MSAHSSELPVAIPPRICWAAPGTPWAAGPLATKLVPIPSGKQSCAHVAIAALSATAEEVGAMAAEGLVLFHEIDLDHLGKAVASPSSVDSSLAVVVEGCWSSDEVSVLPKGQTPSPALRPNACSAPPPSVFRWAYQSSRNACILDRNPWTSCCVCRTGRAKGRTRRSPSPCEVCVGKGDLANDGFEGPNGYSPAVDYPEPNVQFDEDTTNGERSGVNVAELFFSLE